MHVKKEITLGDVVGTVLGIVFGLVVSYVIVFAQMEFAHVIGGGIDPLGPSEYELRRRASEEYCNTKNMHVSSEDWDKGKSGSTPVVYCVDSNNRIVIFQK